MHVTLPEVVGCLPTDTSKGDSIPAALKPVAGGGSSDP